MSPFDEAHFRETATEVEDLIDALDDANEQKPYLHQLLGTLLQALHYATDEYFSDVAAHNILDFKPKKGLAASAADGELELSDGVFVEAYQLLQAVTERMETVLGAKPTLNQFTEFLHTTLERHFPELVTDVASIKATFSKKGKGVKPKPGDVFAVPVAEGGQFLGLVITKNNFGTALGFFRGTDWQGPVTLARHPVIFKYPIYSDQTAFRKKAWKILDHQQELLTLFPSEPEIFHNKRYFQDDPDIGTFGSGQLPDESLRHLSKGEAEEIGLLDDFYDDLVLPEQMLDYLTQLSERNP